MKVVSIDGIYAQVESDGVRRRVGLALLPEAEVGDDVLIHAGYAISRIDPVEAEETRMLLKQLWAAQEAERQELEGSE
jgi:hydrogenase expression/formation protein HypC